jgi:hypothetical protein
MKPNVLSDTHKKCHPARFGLQEARKRVDWLMPWETSEIKGGHAECKASRLEVVIQRGQAQLLPPRQIQVGRRLSCSNPDRPCSRIVKRCEYTSSYRYDCTPSITHADGSLVTWEQPARPGEILVMYALGLGRTIPPTPTGAAPAEPRAVEWERAVQLFFDYSENAAPKVPPDPVPDHPVYVGAVPGFVGLYQINFRVPPAPPGTRLCDHPARSNLTVTVASKIYDGAGICVAP